MIWRMSIPSKTGHQAHTVSWYWIILALVSMLVGVTLLLVPQVVRWRVLGTAADTTFQKKLQSLKESRFPPPPIGNEKADSKLIADLAEVLNAHRSMQPFSIGSRYDALTSFSETNWSTESLGELKQHVIEG